MPLLPDLAKTVALWALGDPRTPPGQPQDGPPPSPAPLPAAPAPTSDLIVQLAAQVAQLQVQVAGLPGLYQEMAERAERAAERERKSSSRRRKEPEDGPSLPDHDGSESVPRSDAQGGPAEGVLPLQRAVGSDDPYAELRRTLAFSRRPI